MIDPRRDTKARPPADGGSTDRASPPSMTMQSKVSRVDKIDKKAAGCFVYGFFGVFALAGSVAFVFVTIIPIYNLVSAQSWDATPCTIQSSSIETHHGESTTYSVDITYRFEVDGVPYDGDRYNFTSGSSSGYDAKAEVVEAHPVGLETTCYVDTNDPTRSVINRSPGWFLLWGLFPLPFLFVGYGGIAWFLFAGRTVLEKGAEDLPAALREPSDRPTLTSQDLPSTDLTSARSQTLKARGTPLGNLVITVFLALFWNGIVAVFLFHVFLPDYRAGNPDWFLGIFLVPFALVGLVFIAGVGHAFLALFNPRVEVGIHDGYITTGETCPVHWRFEGRTNRIRRLTITFEGKESATYRRGTSSYTDHHTFFTEEIFSTDHPGMITRGQCELRVPMRTMPTFESSNNEINWSVTVHGDIPFWPDVKETLPVKIHPPEPELWGKSRWG